MARKMTNRNDLNQQKANNLKKTSNALPIAFNLMAAAGNKNLPKGARNNAQGLVKQVLTDAINEHPRGKKRGR